MPRPKPVEHLMACLGRLPGIGPKTSERLAYHLLRVPATEAAQLVDAIQSARADTKVCRICHWLDEQDPCSICSDAGRDRSMLLVVEDPRDVAAFEEAGYRGTYHVLQGRLSSSEGIGADALTLDGLMHRVRREPPAEVCLATSPDLEGEATAELVAERLRAVLPPEGVRLSRLARGLPAGASIRHAAKSVLQDAVEGRRRL